MQRAKENCQSAANEAAAAQDSAVAAGKARARLRSGFTTGACAAAAAKAAYLALLTGRCPDEVGITLPGGQRPCFALHLCEHLGDNEARAGIIKDAGDDPDITHGALVISTVRLLQPGQGVRFVAGEGVGTVTLPGLPLPPGEPAINPGPRLMIRTALQEALAEALEEARTADMADAPDAPDAPDVAVEISIPGGEELARRTMNPRLGIIGGLSILGTTGIVRPYSCAAWIASIREGVDVARALGLAHVIGATGRTSERAAQELFGVSEQALIDMGDFAGGLLKYVRNHPVPRLTIAGGPAKLAKLGMGMLDLHSKRGQVDMRWLAEQAGLHGADAEAIAVAGSVGQALELAHGRGMDLASPIARAALATIRDVLRDAPVRAGVLVVDRSGAVLAQVEEPA